MITCHVRYVIKAQQIAQFEHYAKLWIPLVEKFGGQIPLVEKFGGQHHGYYLPAEGANNIALALFSFPSLAAYEQYRLDSQQDPECIAAFDYAEKHDFIASYERSFFRPVLSHE